MEKKKNVKVDVAKKSVLFLQIGLVAVLLVSWIALEHKTYEKGNMDIGKVDYDQIEEEDIDMVIEFTTPPPPPPPRVTPQVITVIDNENPLEEDPFITTEGDPDEPIEIPVSAIDDEPLEEEPIDVPFTIIEDVPVFPGCENAGNNAQKRQCMSDKIKKLVNRKFNTAIGEDLGLTGVNRIYVQFKIDTKGDVVNVKARAPHAKLEKEAHRVVKALPKMIPGKQRGKKVGVMYTLPIVFSVE